MPKQPTLYIYLNNGRVPRNPDASKLLCTITNVEPGEIPRVGDNIELLYDLSDTTSTSHLDLYRVHQVVFLYSPPIPRKGEEWVIDRSADKHPQIRIEVHLIDHKMI